MSAIASIIIGAVAAIASATVTGVTASQSAQDLEAANTEARRMGRQNRLDNLRRHRAEEGLSRQRMQLDRAGLRLGTIQANRQHKLAREQFQVEKGLALRGEKRQASQTALGNMMDFINSNEQLKNQAMQRFGA